MSVQKIKSKQNIAQIKKDTVQIKKNQTTSVSLINKVQTKIAQTKKKSAQLKNWSVFQSK